MISHITRLFPLWAILGCLIAWFIPQTLTPWKPAILPLLALIMFAMGLSLTGQDFKRAVNSPRQIFLGLVLQYSLMPLLAWLIATRFHLSTTLLAGMLLVGAAPGGTASNVICYLARGNVALSVTLTSLSTLLAVILTPVLTHWYIGTRVEVPVVSMLQSIFMLVIAPVLLGTFLNTWLQRWLRPLQPVFPLISVAAIVIIIMIIVALNHARIPQISLLLASAVLLHNLSGLTAGYWLSRLAGMDSRDARTLAIETGMQNSGLAVALAIKYFSPLAALPGALFSILHNLTGSALASWWRRR